MNTELQELAALALRNAFWTESSAVANKFLKAAEGLDAPAQEMQMDDMTGIYGRDCMAESDMILNIWVKNECGSIGYETIAEALKDDEATEVHLCGKKVFERCDGEWRFLSE